MNDSNLTRFYKKKLFYVGTNWIDDNRDWFALGLARQYEVVDRVELSLTCRNDLLSNF